MTDQSESLRRWILIGEMGIPIYPSKWNIPPENRGMPRDQAERWGSNLKNPPTIVPADEFFGLPNPDLAEDD